MHLKNVKNLVFKKYSTPFSKKTLTDVDKCCGFAFENFALLILKKFSNVFKNF